MLRGAIHCFCLRQSILQPISLAQSGFGGAEIRIDLQRLLENDLRADQVLRLARVLQIAAALHEILVSLGLAGGVRAECLPLFAAQRNLQRGGHAVRDLIFDA